LFPSPGHPSSWTIVRTTSPRLATKTDEQLNALWSEVLVMIAQPESSLTPQMANLVKVLKERINFIQRLRQEVLAHSELSERLQYAPRSVFSSSLLFLSFLQPLCSHRH
jgi:hypothetical protein